MDNVAIASDFFARQIVQGDYPRHYKGGLGITDKGTLFPVFARDLDWIELGSRVESFLTESVFDRFVNRRRP